jgi:hypothetical protein
MLAFRGRPLLASLSVVAAAVTIAGLAAVAAGGLKTKSATTSIAAGDEGAATAKCKRGSEAVSGGFAIPDFDPNYIGGAIWTIDSHREGKRGWTSSGHNYSGGGGPGHLDVFAYCDKSEPGLKVKSASVDVPATGLNTPIASATARCKKGSEAVSGGGGSADEDFSDGGKEVLLVESRRVGKRKWTVTGANYGTLTGELVAFAYCDKSEPGLKTKSKTATLAGYPDIGGATAKCKKGNEAVSGGFSGDFDPTYSGAVIAPVASKRAGKRKWSAIGENDGPAGGDFVAYAYCQKK